MSTAPARLNWPFAAAWAVVTFIAWLVATWLDPSALSIAYVLPAGILAQLVTVGLRWPWISQPLEPREPWAAQDHEWTWVLCWISQCHLLGIVMLGPGWLLAGALALILLANECLLLRFAPEAWDGPLRRWLPESLLRPDAEDPFCLRTHDEHDESDFESDMESEFESEFESQKLSATFHGHSEDGLPYLQGWQRYEIAPGQKSVSLTIGFFPPFISAPDCQLDHEGEEEIRYELEHITPAGARVMLKRRQASEAIEGKLLWHAVASAVTPFSAVESRP